MNLAQASIIHLQAGIQMMHGESPVAGKRVAFVTKNKGRLLAVGVALTIFGIHQADPQEKAVESCD